MKKNFLLRTTFLTICMITVCLFNHAFAQSWNTTGNAGITPSNYLGTKDTKALVFRTNALERGRLFGTSGTWRFGNANDNVQIESSGVLTFNGKGFYKVRGNRYVFKYSGNPKYGLFFNSTNMQYEFRNGNATPVFYVDANTGAGTFLGPVKIGAYTLPATDGTTNQVLKTDGTGHLSWENDYSTTYTAGTGISIASGTITNTSPDQVVSLFGNTGIAVSGSYPSFTISGNDLWNKTGNAGTSSSTNFIGTTDSVDFVTKTNGNEVMRVTATGNVGIGITAPSFKLGVVGNTNGIYGFGANYGIWGNSSNSIGVYGTGGNYGGYFSSTDGWGSKSTSNNDYGSYHYSYNNHALYAYNFNNAIYFAGFFNGDVYTSGVYSSSDKNLKKNIKDFSSAMSIINQLQPKEFDFKHDGMYAKMNLPRGNHYGLIAQDVEKVLPNLVKDSKFDIPDEQKFGKEPDTTKQPRQSINFKAVNYTEFIPILIKAIQEQQKEIDDLKTKVESLEQQKSFSSSRTASDVAENNITITSATLAQNIPNPLTNSTNIGYYIPSNLHNAILMINDMNGKNIKQITLQPGKGNITIDATTLSAGAYSYSLIINGKMIAKKKMIVTR